MEWRVAKSLDQLLKQINEFAPHRHKQDDGSIGNAEHAVRTSDHNPWVHDGDMGVVTARDFTHDPEGGFDSYAFAEWLRNHKDNRIKYVISNRKIMNSHTDPWEWRPYSGTNPHDHHVHVSVSAEKGLFDDGRPWIMPVENTIVVDHDRPKPHSTVVIGDTGEEVEYAQRMLGTPATGVFGFVTEAKVKEFQKRYDLVVDGRIGSQTWKQLEA